MSDTGTGIVSLMNGSGTAYAVSFGYLPDQTTYFNPHATGMGQVDRRPELKALVEKGMEAEMKALSVAGMGAGTAGYSLVPVYVDNVITDRSRKFTPWPELIQRVSNMGVTADFNYITSKGAAVTAAEDAPLSDVTDTEARGSIAMKYLYSVGRVTGVAQASVPSYIIKGSNVSGNGANTATFGNQDAPNAKQYEIIKRANALKQLEEGLIWNGNKTTSVYGGANGSEYDGIIQQQSTTNKVDKNTTALEWADIEAAVEKSYNNTGRPSLAGSDADSLVDVRKLMIDNFRYTPKDMIGTAGYGVPASVVIETMVGPVPLVPSQYLSTTTAEKSIYFLDTEHIEMRVLQDMTYEDLAKTNDSQKFMLKVYEALVLKAPSFNSFIGEIK